MKPNYESPEYCRQEIVRLETENAALRARLTSNNGPLLDHPAEETRRNIEQRLARLLVVEEQLGKLRHQLAVEQARSRILALDGARRVSEEAWKRLTSMDEKQVASGVVTIPAYDLMLMLAAIPPVGAATEIADQHILDRAAMDDAAA